MTQTRAEVRREKRAAEKAAQYARTGFADQSKYQPAPQPNRNGSRHNGGYTPQELHRRALDRQERTRMVKRFVTERQEASREADKDRRKEAKRSRLERYFDGLKKPQPTKYKHSAARQRKAA